MSYQKFYDELVRSSRPLSEMYTDYLPDEVTAIYDYCYQKRVEEFNFEGDFPENSSSKIDPVPEIADRFAVVFLVAELSKKYDPDELSLHEEFVRKNREEKKVLT